MQIAIIGCGEVGGAYARALRDKATLLLCDIVSGGRPGILSEEMGLPLNAAPGDWLQSCDFAIAAVPGRSSAVAAASALPFLSQGSVYIDVSTGAPDSLRQSSKDFEASSRAFVDIAIMGAIALTGGKTPVLVAGEQATRACEVFALMETPSKILEDGAPGDAVALKLLRSVVIKGLECVSIESLTAAQYLGVRDKLIDVLGDLDQSPIADYMSALVTTHILHAERRMHEMEESAAQLRALGFDATVTGALEQRYMATLDGRGKNPPPGDAHESLDKALDWLITAGRTKTGN
jgi:3-hydroxyisobutyrate dehydrogenase-like beta-hydroxyacid dehydrogenase